MPQIAQEEKEPQLPSIIETAEQHRKQPGVQAAEVGLGPWRDSDHLINKTLEGRESPDSYCNV